MFQNEFWKSLIYQKWLIKEEVFDNDKKNNKYWVCKIEKKKEGDWDGRLV